MAFLSTRLLATSAIASGLLLAHGSRKFTSAREDPFWRSRHQVQVQNVEKFGLFAGNSNLPLANEVASNLGVSLGKATIDRFSDGEINLNLHDNVRGKEVYIIQSTCSPVNEHLMELLLMVSTCRRSSAKKITAVIPYYGYARQDRKMASRVPISAADVAKLLESVGVDKVIACDLHCGQIQGFFGPTVPVDNLNASIVAIEHFRALQLHDPVVISPDAGGVYRAKMFQDYLRAADVKADLAMIIKQRSGAGQIGQMNLVGSVKDRDAIIIDDMIDTAGTLCEAAQQLVDHGARRVFCFATHGLFSKDAFEKIERSKLTEIIVTNSIPLAGQNTGSAISHLSQPAIGSTSKISQSSISLLLAEAIRRSHQNESLSSLFLPK